MIRSSLYAKLTATVVVTLVACNAQLFIEDDTGENEGRWTGNAPDCPSNPPPEEGTCAVEGRLCSFETPSLVNTGHFDQALFGCWEASRGDLRWHRYDGIGNFASCATAEPGNGDDCFGSFGLECHYPERTMCMCSSDTSSWTCEDTGRDNLAEPPAGVPAETPIAALTDAERAEWCGWLTTLYNGPGFPEPTPANVDANGYTMNNGCHAAWYFPCLAFVPTLSSADCQANLALSSCEAPISELSDCVLTVIDSCWPSPHGCARYLEQPGCSGTMAVANPGMDAAGGSTPGSGLSDLCRVRVR